MSWNNRASLSFRPLWDNGSCSYEVTFPTLSWSEKTEIERVADELGFVRNGESWSPPSKAHALSELSAFLQACGFKLEFAKEDDDAPFNLQRLHLEAETRRRLEALRNFELHDLSGWTPVQAEGIVDSQYFYFRARYAHWRIEIGGSENGSRSPRWWYEESWPTETGFGAGYLTDEEAVCCILKAIDIFLWGSHDNFCPDHADYEKTILDGWSLGAIGLQTAAIRLGMPYGQVVERAKELTIELPWTSEHEIRLLEKRLRPLHRLKAQRPSDGNG